MPVASLHGKILKDDEPIVMLEKDRNPIGNRIQIDFVESRGGYAKFNDQRISPFRACKIGIYTDRSGIFQVNHLFPGAT